MRTSTLPPQSKLHSLLNYEPISGVFVWEVDRGRVAKKGTIAGHVSSAGYVSIRIDSKPYAAHRLAWAWMTGEDPGELTVDHIDRNRQNNAFENLRLATARQQRFNRKIKPSTGTDFDERRPKKPWKARFDGKRLGCFETQEQAHAAYLKAYKEKAGLWANTSQLFQDC